MSVRALQTRRVSRRSLLCDASGATLTEFGLLIPVLALLLMGALDIGHSLYMRAVLQGVVQKTARNSALESGGVAANQAMLDAKVRAQVLQLANHANIVITRRFYRSFTKAAAAQAEPLTDTNANGKCDNGEPFEDRNGNGVRDADGGSQGQGGAKDTVLYTVAVSYPRMFPMDGLLGLPSTSDFKATTVLANQPYGDQESDTAKVGKCPLT